jgi:hypothetical protein
MSAWSSSIPLAPRRGSTKTYTLSEPHKQWLRKGFAFAETQISQLAGPEQAPSLIKALKEGLNFETIDEGFAREGESYTILGISHKGQSAGNSAWTTLEPHVAKRDVIFGLLILGLSSEAPKGMFPFRSNHDTLADGKVIGVTRCHFTPDGRPLGMCRKEDRVGAQQPKTKTLVSAGAAQAAAWGATAAPTAQTDPAPF